MEDAELLTVENAARAMQIGRSTLYEWIAEGLIPVFRVHGVVRIPRAALVEMIDAQVQGAATPPASGPSESSPRKSQ